MRLLQISLLGTLLILAGSVGPAANADDGVVRLSDAPAPSDGVVVATSVPGLYDETYMVFRQDFGDGRGFVDGFSSISGFAPLYKFSPEELVFTDSRLFFTADGQLGGNVSLGWRREFSSIGKIAGASFWFDTDESDKRSRANQFGFGLEFLSTNWGLRGNFYNPTAHGDHPLETVRGNTPFFRGNQILFNDVLFSESALTSADVELGIVVPRAPWLKFYIGPYWYSDEKHDSKWGVKGRFEAQITDAAMGQIALSNDPLFGTNLTFAVAYTLGPKWQPLRPFQRRTLHQRLFEQVARANRIAFREIRRAAETPAINPVTNQPYFVTHVDPNGGPGSGTYENPANSASFANAANVDIIRVLPGNFASPGTITLFNNQRLLAANHPHTFIDATRGTFVLPGQVAGSNPVLTNALGGNVIALASNNEVSGFDIDGGGTGAGIFGSGIADFNLNNLNITGATEGIQLFNFAQTGQLPPFGNTNTIQGVSVTGSVMSGIHLRQDDGGTGVVLIDSSSSVGNGADGLRLTAAGGSTVNATVQNSSFNLNMQSGVRVNVRDAGSNVALTATNVAAHNNTMDGLLFDIDTGGSFVANLSNSSLQFNGRNAIRAILAGGSTGTLNATDIMALSSGEHGVFVSVTDSTLNPSTFLRVDASNSGQLLSVGLRDAFNFDVSNSTATVSIVDSTGINTGGGMTQENGLRLISDLGSVLTTTVSGGNFSNNAVSAINVRVRDAGTNSMLTVSNTLGNNSGVDGFFYDVTGGSFTAMVTGSSFNSSGRNAIRAIGGTSPAVMNVTFDSTTANLSMAEGVFFDIDGMGGPSTFNFTYLPTPPSAILGSGGPFGVMATFAGAMTTGTVDFNGITINGGINAITAGTTVTVTP
jgi:Inverse autotransporter, beta-domain